MSVHFAPNLLIKLLAHREPNCVCNLEMAPPTNPFISLTDTWMHMKCRVYSNIHVVYIYKTRTFRFGIQGTVAFFGKAPLIKT